MYLYNSELIMYLNQMKTRNTLTLFLLICSTLLFAQHNLNDYKYVIVQKQFPFQNEPNQYNLNRLVQFELQKLGFKALIEGQGIPEDLKKDICLALTTDVTSKGALRTKAIVKFIDCNGDVVMQSGEGITKEKAFNRAYQLAIQKAFDTMSDIVYAYNGKSNIDETDSASEEEAQEKIERLQAEVDKLKAQKGTAKDQASWEASNEASSAKNTSEEIISQEDVEDSQQPKTKEEKDWKTDLPFYSSEDFGNLYLKEEKEYTLLVNEKNETVLKLKPTSQNTVYHVTIDETSGVAFFDAASSNITIEYYANSNLKVVQLKRSN